MIRLMEMMDFIAGSNFVNAINTAGGAPPPGLPKKSYYPRIIYTS